MPETPENTSGDSVTPEQTPDQSVEQAHDQLLVDTEKRLAAFNAANGEPDADPELVTEPVVKPEGDVQPEGDVKPEDVEDRGVTPKAEPAGEPVETPAGPTLPESYRRSLRAFDWTDEEIDAYYESQPDKCLTFAEKIHRSRNDQTARFADAGRRARDASALVTQPAQPAARAAEVGPNGLKLIDTEKMIEQFGGNEELVNTVVGPVNEVIRQINDFLPDLQSSVQTIKRTTRDTLAEQIENFFVSKDMTSFKDVYGSLKEEALSDGQQQSRSKVLEMADAILSGATLQGRQMSVEEALLAAHDSTASDLIATRVRAEIKTAVTKRAQSVTLKPSGSEGESSLGDSQPQTRNELEVKARQGLAKVFGA